jgi:peptidoglycan hydrolase-like protein with peptidoglycan-binding domain
MDAQMSAVDKPRRRRGRRWLVVLVVALVAGAAVAGYLLVTRPGPAPADEADEPQETAQVTRTTLVETEDIDGTLGYGAPVPLVNRLAGTVTSTAAAGATVSHGQALYSLDQDPVVLFYGAVPAYRTLQVGVVGEDVRQFEENLRAVGYLDFTIDETFSAATDRAVRRWQRDVGLTDNGVVELGRVVFLGDAIRVAEVAVRPGGAAEPEQPVLSYTGTTRLVTAAVDIDQRALAVPGSEVTVALPGNRQVPAMIAGVGSVAVPEESADSSGGRQQDSDTGGSDSATFTVTCTIADQNALAGLDEAPVTIALVGQRRENVLTVPVAALLALREGGYGVQVVTGSRGSDGRSTDIVPVETGLFAGGLVEVSGPDLAEGTEVTVPAP